MATSSRRARRSWRFAARAAACTVIVISITTPAPSPTYWTRRSTSPNTAAGERTATRARFGGQHREHGRRDHGAGSHQAAHPHDQRHHVEIAQHDHLSILRRVCPADRAGPALSALPRSGSRCYTRGRRIVVPVETSACAGAEEHRHAAAYRVDPLHDRSGQRASDHVLFGGRYRGRAVLRRDALRPGASAASRQPTASCSPRATRRRLLYAAWAEAGFIPRDDLLTLRQFSSDLEGHPTPRLPFVDVATGSLGQGLCAGVGIALNARRIGSDYRTYVLLGDGETAEGSVWEAAAAGGVLSASTTCAGSPMSTPWARAAPPSRARHGGASRAAGRRSAGTPSSIDGHDMAADPAALDEARAHQGTADDDPGAHAQGQGHLLHRRQAQLARQGAEEGRRD